MNYTVSDLFLFCSCCFAVLVVDFFILLLFF